MRSIKEAVRHERVRLEIVGPTGIDKALSDALGEYGVSHEENQSYFVVSQGKRIGRRVEFSEKRGKRIYKNYFFIDVPISYDVNVRQGIEINETSARFYTSDMGTKFEYLGDASLEDIRRFRRLIPYPAFPKTPLRSK